MTKNRRLYDNGSYQRKRVYPVFEFLIYKYPPVKRGGISVSGIALRILAAHKCAVYWPVSHAIVM